MFIHLLISFSSFFILKEIHIFSSQDKCSISRHTVVVFNIWHKEAKVNILFLWNKYERSISMRRMGKDIIKIYKSLTLSMRLIRWWQKSPARALEYLQLPWKPSSSAVGGKPRRLMSLRSLYASLLRHMSRIRLHLSSPSLWFCCTFYSLSSILLLLHAIPSLLFLFPSSRRREHTIQNVLTQRRANRLKRPSGGRRHVLPSEKPRWGNILFTLTTLQLKGQRAAFRGTYQQKWNIIFIRSVFIRA